MTTPIHAAAAKKTSHLRRGSLFRRGLTVFPMLLLPVIIYLIMAIFSGTRTDPDVPSIAASLDAIVISIPMISGVRWQLPAGDLLLLLALAMLAIDPFKGVGS